MSETKNIPISQIEPNKGQIEGLPKNPRFIKDARFEALKKSIEDAPEMLALRELIVYPIKGQSVIKYVAICGNMRLRACQQLGYKELPCKVLPVETPVEKLREYTIKDNVAFGQDSWDELANEWDEKELLSWGFELPKWDDGTALSDEIDDTPEEETEEQMIERKEREFRERMEAGEIGEDDEEYQEFVEKFKLKKTTDDCYTPKLVYDAVADWVAKEYNLSGANFVRPFYPNGNYQKENYSKDCVVVDNPPFSILSEILTFYKERGIKYFLFAPHLTLFSSSANKCAALVIGVAVTYENGANVNTSFLTNLEDATIRCKSCPTLYAAIKEANDANLKEMRKELPKYSYDWHVITTSMLSPFSRLGIDFVVTVAESQLIRQLDAQKESGKALYGNGYLISERLFAAREKAEREKAEREKAERWELSDREKAIVAKLSK